MTKRKLTESEQLDRLADEIIQFISDISDEEIIAEAKESYGGEEIGIGQLFGVLERALEKKIARERAKRR